MSSEVLGGKKYYLPDGSHWPLLGSVALFTLMIGLSIMLNGHSFGVPLVGVGFAILLIMMFGWFGTVIGESMGKYYNQQVDTSFRLGMVWFIFSEVMFFAAFFGALFYARILSLPWLGGEGSGTVTNYYLWHNFEALWPSMGNGPANLGGGFQTMYPWGIPALNTVILLSSGATVTWAHHGLKQKNYTVLQIGLATTVLLGFLFLGFQAYEFYHAYTELDLKLTSGIYGSTFFMLTGFHGLHVTIGAIMLFVMLARSMRGHFTPKQHFAFEATTWYWHFVDAVWLGLFVFVYWI